MFLTLLTLFLDTFDTAQAIHLSQPRQTTLQDNISGASTGWTPKPTSPPRFAPWLAKEGHGQLVVRQDVNAETCGYINGDAESALKCGPSVCAFYKSYKTKAFVCCPTTASGTIEAGHCPYRSKCLDFGVPGNNHWGAGEIVGTDQIISCGWDEPACYVMVNSDSYGGDTYSFFGCDVTTAWYNAAMTISSGEPHSRQTKPPESESQYPFGSETPALSAPSEEQSSLSLEATQIFEQPPIPTMQAKPNETDAGPVTNADPEVLLHAPSQYGLREVRHQSLLR